MRSFVYQNLAGTREGRLTILLCAVHIVFMRVAWRRVVRRSFVAGPRHRSNPETRNTIFGASQFWRHGVLKSSTPSYLSDKELLQCSLICTTSSNREQQHSIPWNTRRTTTPTPTPMVGGRHATTVFAARTTAPIGRRLRTKWMLTPIFPSQDH